MKKVVLFSTTSGRLYQSQTQFVEYGDPIDNIQGTPVASGVPASGQFIRYNGSHWVYVTIPDINSAGDVIVDNIRGIGISSAAPEEGQALVYDAVNNVWKPVTPSGTGGGGSITVKEIDGSPNITEVNTIEFPNNSVQDLGGGAVRVTISGGTGGGGDTSPGGLLYLFHNFT